MKKFKGIFFLLISLFCLNKINSQSIKFFGYDHITGQRDSVTFGFDQNATMGIDEALGEIDITNTPANTNNMRVIQRTAEDFECLYDENEEEVYFSNSFESKINLRPLSPTSEGDNSLYFEVKNYTANFDWSYEIVITDYVNPPSPNNQYLLGFSANYDCDPTNNMLLDSYLTVIDIDPPIGPDPTGDFSILVLLDEPPIGENYTHFYFKIQPNDISTEIDEPNLASYNIYPNPADEFIHLEGYDRESTAYELYNIQGQLVKQGDLSISQTKIITADLAAGLYVVNILSINGQSTARNLISIY